MDLYLKLLTELGISVTDVHVWLAIALAVALFVACTAIGARIAQSIGMLDREAPAGETLGVGLATSLVVLAALWASIGSGGRSSFTPVAIGFALAVAAAGFRGRRHPTPTGSHPRRALSEEDGVPARTSRRRRSAIAVAGGATFIALVALLYGSTIAPSPRDGVQPVEFMDEDFYSILAADLATTGTETIVSPSGFVDIPGLPSQNWYHWGELWLGSAVIKSLDVEPIATRHFIVLPILLLAAATLTGTLVRRMNRTTSSGAFFLGVMVCTFLAPVPVFAGTYFSSRAAGLVFGITTYGLAAVAVLLAFHAFVAKPKDRGSWVFAAFVGALIASIVPAHVVIALLAGIFGGTIAAIRVIRSRVLKQQLEIVPVAWRRTIVCACIGIASSVAWGFVTGHGIPASAVSPLVTSFNGAWQGSITSIVLGAGAFYAVGVAWVLARRTSPEYADIYVAVTVVVAAAALTWGARLADFNMFHVFFGAIAVFATPAAAVAMWSLWVRVRERMGRLAKIGVATLFFVQLEVGVVLGVAHLQEFGPRVYAAVPTTFLATIRALPDDSQIAYSCGPTEEISYWVPRLLSVGVHTHRRIVPMCFEADALSFLVGGPLSPDVESPLFRTAPQRALYPTPTARPSSEAVAGFLRSHGIGYIYVDDLHPNELAPDAIPVTVAGQFQLLRLP